MRVSPQESEAHLERMAQMCSEAGVKMALLFPAHRIWMPEYEFPMLRERYLEAVRRVAERHRLVLVDAQEKFMELGMEKLMIDACHMNELGHELIGQLLLPVVKELVEG